MAHQTEPSMTEIAGSFLRSFGRLAGDLVLLVKAEAILAKQSSVRLVIYCVLLFVLALTCYGLFQGLLILLFRHNHFTMLASIGLTLLVNASFAAILIGLILKAKQNLSFPTTRGELKQIKRLFTGL